MKIILVRHGQTNYNLKDLCNGLPNKKVHLTILGKKQARIVANKLANVKFEEIFISKLYRSRQTAEIINKYHKVKIYADQRLNDRLMGEFEGRPASLFYTWRDQHKNLWTCKPRNGESYEHLKKRVVSFLKDLSKKDYHTVLIVTHLPIIKVMRGYFNNLSNTAMDKPDEKDIPNGKILIFNLKVKKSKIKK